MISGPALEKTQDLDPDRFNTLAELYEHIFASYPDKPAFTCFGHTISFAELDRASARLAGWLRRESGLRPGDRIAIQLPNLLQFPVAAVAATRAGLILVNTNPLYTGREMRHQLSDSGAKGIIILANFAQKLQKILPETDIECVVVTELGDMLPTPRRTLMNLGARYLKRMVPAYRLPDAVRWRSIFGKDIPPLEENVDAGTDVAIILYTGGTTGPAKGAMLTHRNLIWNMMQLRSTSRELLHDGEDTIVAPLPLYHTYAFMLHCLSMCYAGNCSVLIPNPRDIDDLINVMKSVRVNGIIGINTLYLALCRHKRIHEVDFSDIRFSGAGGMAMSANVAREWENITRSPVYEGYGLTECSPVVTTNPPEQVKIGTVGKPVPETDLMLVDDEGREISDEEKGELWVRGPQVMKGYWQNEEATREAITEEGWFKTGDYARFDEDDYVRIVDRKKDMINVSGFNVFPSEIEEVVNSHPGVYESAAIGIPDEASGEIIKLFVVKHDDVLTEQDVMAHCRDNLTPYKLPREIVFVTSLPKSNVGKILHRELREQEQQPSS